WREVEQGAPQIARLGLARLGAVPVAMLGTIRPDGSPRISPIEPYLVNGQLLVGAMTWSKKASDLHRDPRYTLHSVVSGTDSGEGDLRRSGSAVRPRPDLRGPAVGAGGPQPPREEAVVFSLRIAPALFVEGDLEHGRMTVHHWTPRSGYSHSTRRYP